MANERPFAMNRRRFVASLAGFTAAVPLLRAPGIAHAAGLLTGPASVAAQQSLVFIDARTTESAGLDPHNVPALANFRVTHLMYEGLTWLDENLVIQPMLAESWEIPDPTTYVFHIRQGVQFHNGADLTAEDVKATIERILDESTGSSVSRRLAAVACGRILDKYIVQFKLATAVFGSPRGAVQRADRAQGGQVAADRLPEEPGNRHRTVDARQLESERRDAPGAEPELLGAGDDEHDRDHDPHHARGVVDHCRAAHR